MPNEVTFPFEQINVVLKDGSQFTLQGPELHSALQYIPTQGYPPLVQSLKEFTYRVHQPPHWEKREILVTNGSQDGISKSLEMMVEEGDDVLVQNPLYTGTEIIVSEKYTILTGLIGSFLWNISLLFQFGKMVFVSFFSWNRLRQIWSASNKTNTALYRKSWLKPLKIARPSTQRKVGGKEECLKSYIWIQQVCLVFFFKFQLRKL